MKVEVVGDPLPYGMLYHKAGKIIEIPDGSAKLLIKLGRVKALSEVRKSRRVYRRRDMVAEPVAVEVESVTEPVVDESVELVVEPEKPIRRRKRRGKNRTVVE